MSRRLSNRDQFYTGVIVVCAVLYSLIGCYLLIMFVAWRFSVRPEEIHSPIVY